MSRLLSSDPEEEDEVSLQKKKAIALPSERVKPR